MEYRRDAGRSPAADGDQRQDGRNDRERGAVGHGFPADGLAVGDRRAGRAGQTATRPGSGRAGCAATCGGCATTSGGSAGPDSVSRGRALWMFAAEFVRTRHYDCFDRRDFGPVMAEIPNHGGGRHEIAETAVRPLRARAGRKREMSERGAHHRSRAIRALDLRAPARHRDRPSHRRAPDGHLAVAHARRHAPEVRALCFGRSPPRSRGFDVAAYCTQHGVAYNHRFGRCRSRGSSTTATGSPSNSCRSC